MHGVEALHYRRGVVVKADRQIAVQYGKRIGLDVVHRERACVDSCRIDGTGHIDTEVRWRSAHNNAATGGAGHRTARGCRCGRGRYG